MNVIQELNEKINDIGLKQWTRNKVQGMKEDIIEKTWRGK